MRSLARVGTGKVSLGFPACMGTGRTHKVGEMHIDTEGSRMSHFQRQISLVKFWLLPSLLTWKSLCLSFPRCKIGMLHEPSSLSLWKDQIKPPM
jgi:hypothetical protein